MTQTSQLGKMLKRKRGITSHEIIDELGSVSPHSLLAKMKKRGWTILTKDCKGQSGRAYKRYFGVAPEAQ